jgi:para-aminobenzoate synthetase component 1
MSTIDPVVRGGAITLSDNPPGRPDGCRGHVRELDRREWHVGASAGELEDFLAGHGLPVRDLTVPGRHDPGAAVCGAAVLLSAAAGARLVGGRDGPVSPAPAVPDMVAVVYGHDAAGYGHAVGHGPGVEPTRPTGADAAWADAGWQVGSWRANWTPDDHAAAVVRVREAIARGDVYQVNLVGHQSAPYRGDPTAALHRVAALPGARYGGVLGGDGWAVACASPETLVEVAGGRVVTRPIKGTRPATAAGRAQLLTSGKERAEHVMIVDLERNDLAQVAVTGSVRVDELFAVRRWCGLWQAESVVSARLTPGTGLADLLHATCPGGSVTGAPKLAALDVIAALEPVGRGPSMGAFGWIGPDRVDLGLTIRTVAADPERLHVWAGGGITWGSDPASEVAEAAAKAAPVRAALTG